ncbi:PREDICTED: uncharacterized protein LOC109470119 [Branchiostoma belcheri]|uniref:Uncharacterized protein LOC109470119 n=1 Tax=Branchiostoma belcheri TaxID=7741 RepID=A0A6P4Z4E9_BRABE|nr:PREDICTED: uncharacterized protein LOC109470119 [Branchiostoma belcheri]
MTSKHVNHISVHHLLVHIMDQLRARRRQLFRMHHSADSAEQLKIPRHDKHRKAGDESPEEYDREDRHGETRERRKNVFRLPSGSDRSTPSHSPSPINRKPGHGHHQGEPEEHRRPFISIAGKISKLPLALQVSLDTTDSSSLEEGGNLMLETADRLNMLLGDVEKGAEHLTDVIDRVGNSMDHDIHNVFSSLEHGLRRFSQTREAMTDLARAARDTAEEMSRAGRAMTDLLRGALLISSVVATAYAIKELMSVKDNCSLVYCCLLLLACGLCVILLWALLGMIHTLIRQGGLDFALQDITLSWKKSMDD